MAKQNDWIIASLNNPDFSPMDFKVVADMNLSNTQLLSPDKYKKSEEITQHPLFQTNGSFDEGKFNMFYMDQAKKFGEFSAENQIESDPFEYDMWDITRPRSSRVKNPGFQIFKPFNPDHKTTGMFGDETTDSGYSKKELAQKSKIFDSKTGKWKEESVNDLSFFESPVKYIQSLFDEPLVYATYDEDTEEINPRTGKLEKHHKGEWKVNEDGQYYTETLNGRSVLGKEIVSAGDYVSSEESNMNKYDFFDSDGLDKSVTGTVAKNLVAVAPLVALSYLTPAGAMIYGGLYVGREMAKTLPMLDGMFKSFTGQEVKDNKLLNTISAYGQKFTTGTSEYAQQNTFAAENFVNLMGEVALQWGQQKAIANAWTRLTNSNARTMEAAYGKAAQEYSKRSLGHIMEAGMGKMSTAQMTELTGVTTSKGIKEMISSGAWMNTAIGKAAVDKFIPSAKLALESKMKTGQNLSLVYMALISNTDVYDSVLEAEGTNLEAAAIALGSTIGMFGVDKYLGLGEMFFQDETVRRSFREGWKKSAQEMVDVFSRNVKDKAMSTATRESKKNLIGLMQKGVSKAKEFVTDYHSKMKDHTLGFVGKSIGEGLEEVSEELVADSSKWIGELAGKLGYFSQTDYGSFENPFDRYMMSFLGGAAGGGLFYGVEAFQKRNDPKAREGENELVYLIRNHKKADLMKELDELHKKGKLGSTELSWKTTKDSDGKETFLTASEENESQNDYIYDKLKQVYNHIDMIINNNKVGLSEDELFENMILSEQRINAFKDYFKEKSYVTRYQEHFHELATKMMEKDLQIQQLQNETTDQAKKNDELYKGKLQSLLDEKAELVKQRDDFLSGRNSLPYIKKMLFAIDPRVSMPLMTVNINQFSRATYGRSLDELSESEREAVTKAYDEYSKNKQKHDLDTAFKIYEEMGKSITPELMGLDQLDMKAEFKRFQEVMKKFPVNQYKKWDDKLDGESEETFKDRNTKMEFESDEDFKRRKETRQQLIDNYNNEHMAEFIKNFADMGLDSSSYRLMHFFLQQREKDVLDDIVSKIAITSKKLARNNEYEDSVDVESTNFLRDLLLQMKSESETLEAFKGEIERQEKEKVSKKYEGLGRQSIDGIIYYAVRQQAMDELRAEGKDPDNLPVVEIEEYEEDVFDDDGEYIDTIIRNRDLTELDLKIRELNDNLKPLTAQQMLTGLMSLKENLIKQGKIQADATNQDLLDFLEVGGLSKAYVGRLNNLLKFNEEYQKALAIQDTIKQDVVTELSQTGQIPVNPVDYSEQDISLIEKEVATRMQDVNESLRDSLTNTLYDSNSPELNALLNINVDEENKHLLTLPQISTVYQNILNGQYEVNDDTIREEIKARTEERYNSIEQAIKDKVKERNEDTRIQALKSLDENLYKNNPALKLFSKISAKLGNTDTNVEEFLQSLHEKYQSLDNFAEFELTPDEEKTLDAISQDLEIAQAFVYAASKDTSYQSPVGQNKAVNEFVKNHSDLFGKEELLPEFSEELGQYLIMEFANYQNEIRFLRNRNKNNVINKAETFRVAETKLNDSLKKFHTELKGVSTVKDIDLMEGHNDDMSNTETEELLYNNVQKAINDGKLTYDDIFDTIIPKLVPNIQSIKNQVPSKLDDRLESLNGYDKFTYFVSTIAMPINKYRSKLKSFIEQNDKLVPLSIQMYVGRVLYAMQTNPDVVNKALEWANKQFGTSNKIPFLPNTTILTGVGGAGKSEIAGRIATDNQGQNSWVSGPTQTQVDGLKEKLPNATGYEIDTMLKTILGEQLLAKLNNEIELDDKSNATLFKKVPGVDGNDSFVLNENEITFQTPPSLPKVIIVDEMTHIPQVKLQVLAKFAKDNNIHLTLLGDTTQAGYNQEGKRNNMHNIQKEVIFGWRTPKLYVSLRDATVQKYYNQQGLLQIIDPLVDSIGDSQIDAIMNSIYVNLLPKYQFRYFLDSNQLNGEYITNDITPDLINIFKNNKDANGKQIKVGFISDNPNSELHKKLQDQGVEVTPIYDVKSVQGREFDYVVADINWDQKLDSSKPAETIKFFQKLYTVVTRSKKGTVLIDNHLSDNIKNRKDAIPGLAIDVRNDNTLQEFRAKALESLKDVETVTEPEEKPVPAPKSEESTEKKVKDEIEKQDNQDGTESEEDKKNKEDELKKIQEKINEFENNLQFPIRGYANISVTGTDIEEIATGKKRKDGTEIKENVWIGDGSNRDVSIFLGKGERAQGLDEKKKYVNLVYQMKSLLLFGTKWYDDDGRVSLEVATRFDKSAFENAEFVLVAENPNNSNRLMGLTNLENNRRGIVGDKFMTIQAKLIDKKGNLVRVTLGAAADPETWKKGMQELKNNPQVSAEGKAFAETSLNSLIDQYERKLENIQVGQEEAIDINPGLITQLVNKNPDGTPNPELRLLNLQDGHRPFDSQTPHSIRTAVHFLTKHTIGIDDKYIGKPIMFVTNNVLLNPEDLFSVYLEQNNTGVNYGVTLVPLSNKGLSFRSLYLDRYRIITQVPGQKNTLPFELLPMGFRMYTSMWNFRSNLLNFEARYKAWEQEMSDSRGWNRDKIMQVIRNDREQYLKAIDKVNEGKEDKDKVTYIDEETYRNLVTENKDELEEIWKFNDGLAESVREFRLGYDDNNGIYVRKLSNISKTNRFYKDTIERLNDKNIYGLYIRPDLMERYINGMNSLFENVINKVIPPFSENTTDWIDFKESTGERWVQDELKTSTKFTLSVNDQYGNSNNQTLEFNSQTFLKDIPTLMVMLGSNVNKYLSDGETNFKLRMENDDPNVPDSQKGRMFITQENGEQLDLNYLSIIDELGLKETVREGPHAHQYGMKPFSEEGGITTGTVDRTFDIMMNVMFHGLPTLSEENNFDNRKDLRANDAMFRFGFFSDPMGARKTSNNDFALIANNEALFSTNLLPAFPIFNWRFKENSKPQPIEVTRKLEVAPEIKPETPSVKTVDFQKTKANVVSLATELGLSIDNKKLEIINTEEELENYVNSLINPIFVKDPKTRTGKRNIEKTLIYRAFNRSGSIDLENLVSQIKIQNGEIIRIIDPNIKQIGKFAEGDDRQVLVPGKNQFRVKNTDNKIFSVYLNPSTYEVVVKQEAIDVESSGEGAKFTYNNIQKTIKMLFDESKLSSLIDSNSKTRIEELIQKMFEEEEINGMLDEESTPEEMTSRINQLIKDLQRYKEAKSSDATMEQYTDEFNKFVQELVLVSNGNNIREGC